ncbi:MAG: outer membrane beta-barrel protein [Pseudomonadota bacterium]
MRSFIAAAAFGAAAATTSVAIADTTTDTTKDWSGPYVGAQLNYSSGSFEGSHENNKLKSRTPFVFDFESKGEAYGGQIGYNHQFDNDIVLGAEIEGVFVEGYGGEMLKQPAGPETAEAWIDFAASARLRLGYAVGPVLPYVSAGVGVVSYETRLRENPGGSPTLPLRVDFDESAIAPVLGAGLEAMVFEDFSVRGDFTYFFIDDETSTFGKLDDAEKGDGVNADGFWKVGIGVNYHF